MLAAIFLVILAIGFYAFIAFSPKEITQLVLALVWLLMLLAVPMGIIMGW